MKHLPFSLLLLAAISAPSQLHAQYVIRREALAGGGGLASAGDAYAVNGTIGQATPGGTSNNGRYSLVGGFWVGTSKPPRSDAPALGAERLGSSGIRLFWPMSATGFVLERATSLATSPALTIWTRVSLPQQTNATRVTVAIPAPVESGFYRLRAP